MINRLRTFLDYDKLPYFKYTCLMMLPLYLLTNNLFEAAIVLLCGILLSFLNYLLHLIVKRICGDVNTLPMCIVWAGGISAAVSNLLNRYVNNAPKVLALAALFSLFLYAMCYREYRISKVFVVSALKKVAFVSFFLIFTGAFIELFSTGTVLFGFVKDGVLISENFLIKGLASFSGLFLAFSILFFILEVLIPERMAIFDFDKKGIIRLFIAVSSVSFITVLINNTVILKLLAVFKISYLKVFTTFAVIAALVFLLQKLISRYYANMVGLISLSVALYIQFISVTSVLQNSIIVLIFAMIMVLLVKSLYFNNRRYKPSVYILSAGVLSFVVNITLNLLFK